MQATVKPYEGTGKYLFISYAHKDMESVMPIIEGLAERGFCIWYDGAQSLGAESANHVADRIRGCACFVPIISENYLNSMNCQSELKYAGDINVSRFFIYIEEIELPQSFLFQNARIRFVRLTESDNFERFIDSIEYALSYCRDKAPEKKKEAEEPERVGENAPYSGEGCYIFISYSHKDVKDVLPVVRALQSNGFNVWYDNELKKRAGKLYENEIARHVEGCECFISMMTQNYLKSRFCMGELDYAKELGKRRFIVYLEKMKLPGAMIVSGEARIQNLDKTEYATDEDFFGSLFAVDVLQPCRTDAESKDQTAPLSISGGRAVSDNTDYSYEGGLKDGKPHGKGRIKFANGDSLECTFADGIPTGYCLMKYANGDMYSGYLDEHMTPHGKGELALKDGDSIEGTWSHGKPEKITKRTYANGDCYEGEFDNLCRPHGKGRITYKDGTVFEGDFEFGEKPSQGKIIYPDGKEVSWSIGNKDYPDGRKYYGELTDNEANGKGVMTFPRKGRSHVLKYEGEFRSGKAVGKGKLICLDSDVYEGDFTLCKERCKGKISFSNTEFSGIWTDSVAGGILHLPNGNRFSGSFSVRYSQYEKVLESIGVYVITIDAVNGLVPEKRGIITFPNGDMYEGEVKGYLPHGKGTMYFSNGRVRHAGRWRKGKPSLF